MKKALFYNKLSYLGTLVILFLGTFIPGVFLYNQIYAADSIIVETNNWGDALEIYAYSDDYTRLITSMWYRIDGGDWQFLPPDDGSYDDYEEYAFIWPERYPGGEHTIEVKVIDEYNEEWPLGYVSEILDNPDELDVYIYTDYIGGEDVVVIEAGSYYEYLHVTNIEYYVDSGDWEELPADDGAYGESYETAHFPLNSVPIGEHTVYARVMDEWGYYYPLPDGYASELVEGTGTIEGGSPTNPIYVTTDGDTYNFTDNSNGHPDYYIYVAADIAEAGDYTLELYDVGDPLELTFIEYYEHDDTYTNLIEGMLGLEFNFYASEPGTYYFIVFKQPRPSPSFFGIKMSGGAVEIPITYSTTVPRQSASSLVIPLQTEGYRRFVAVHLAYRSNDYIADSVVSSVDGSFTRTCVAGYNEYVSEMWYLSDPVLGFSEVTVTWDGSVEDIVAGVVAMEDIDLVQPIRAYGCNEDWSQYPNVTVSSEEEDIIFGGVATYSGGNSLQGDGSVMEVWNVPYYNMISSALADIGEFPDSQLAWEASVSWPWATSAIAIKVNSGGGDVTLPELNFTQSPDDIIGANFTMYPYMYPRV